MTEVKYSSYWSTQFAEVLREKHDDGWDIQHFGVENGMVHVVWERKRQPGGYER